MAVKALVGTMAFDLSLRFVVKLALDLKLEGEAELAAEQASTGEKVEQRCLAGVEWPARQIRFLDQPLDAVAVVVTISTRAAALSASQEASRRSRLVRC